MAFTGVALLAWICARPEGSRRSRPSTTYSRACPRRPESADVTMPAAAQPILRSTLHSSADSAAEDPQRCMQPPCMSHHHPEFVPGYLDGKREVIHTERVDSTRSPLRVLQRSECHAACSPVNAPKETKRAEVCRNATRQWPLPVDASAAKALAKGAAGSILAAGTIAHSTSASSTYSTHAIDVAPIMPTGMSTEGFFTCTAVILHMSGNAAHQPPCSSNTCMSLQLPGTAPTRASAACRATAAAGKGRAHAVLPQLGHLPPSASQTAHKVKSRAFSMQVIPLQPLSPPSQSRQRRSILLRHQRRCRGGRVERRVTGCWPGQTGIPPGPRTEWR